MNWKDWVGGSFILILVYLLVKNGKETSAVLSSIGKVVTAQTMALQGREPGQGFV